MVKKERSRSASAGKARKDPSTSSRKPAARKPAAKKPPKPAARKPAAKKPPSKIGQATTKSDAPSKVGIRFLHQKKLVATMFPVGAKLRNIRVLSRIVDPKAAGGDGQPEGGAGFLIILGALLWPSPTGPEGDPGGPGGGGSGGTTPGDDGDDGGGGDEGGGSGGDEGNGTDSGGNSGGNSGGGSGGNVPTKWVEIDLGSEGDEDYDEATGYYWSEIFLKAYTDGSPFVPDTGGEDTGGN